MMKSTKDISTLSEAQTLEAVVTLYKSLAIADAHLNPESKRWKISSIDVYLENMDQNDSAKVTLDFYSLSKRIDLGGIANNIKTLLGDSSREIKLLLTGLIFQLAAKIKE